jgi:hypothetical protein
LRITLILTIIANICSECPKPDLLKPCNCLKDYITCDESNSKDLKNIFIKLSSTLESDKKHFSVLLLNKTSIDELTENFFEDITFNAILIRDAKNLTLINTKAFTKIESCLKDIEILSTSLKNCPPNHDIFQTISSMTNLETAFIRYSMIEEIPENAFRPLNGPQNKLYDIVLDNNRIKKIGDNAFKNLQNLTNLVLNDNKLDHISKNEFNFNTTSNKTVDIFLYNLSLNSSSFESKAFSSFNKPTFLHFNYSFRHKSNNITYLDQHIFEEFLNLNSMNQIELYTIDCKDCRSYWLVNNDKYKLQIESITCSDFVEISDKNNFSGCEHFV